MAKLVSKSEIIGTVEDGAVEVCATAEAEFDESAAQLRLTLDAFARSTDIRSRERHTRPSFLPPPETLREHVGRDEASELTADAFRRWVRRVRQSIPSLIQT